MRIKSLLDNKRKDRESDRILPKNDILILAKPELIYIFKYHNESIKDLYLEQKDYLLLLKGMTKKMRGFC
jgi:hypothetical protein